MISPRASRRSLPLYECDVSFLNCFVDYATTTIETKESTPNQIQEEIANGKLNTIEVNTGQTPLNEPQNVEESRGTASIEPIKISEQSGTTTSKSLKIDALYFLNKFNNLVKEYLGGSKSIVGSPDEKEFDLDEFHAQVMSDKQFELNKTWYTDYFIMSCPAKSFIERFSVQGEFFEKHS